MFHDWSYGSKHGLALKRDQIKWDEVPVFYQI